MKVPLADSAKLPSFPEERCFPGIKSLWVVGVSAWGETLNGGRAGGGEFRIVNNSEVTIEANAQRKQTGPLKLYLINNRAADKDSI